MPSGSGSAGCRGAAATRTARPAIARPRQVGVGPWPGPWPDDPALRPGRCCATATGATSSTVTGTGRSRRSAPTWTPAGIRSTWPSRTGRTTSTSARSSGPRTPSTRRGCTSSGRRRWNRRGAMVTDRYLHVHAPPGRRGAGGLGGRATGLPAARRRQPAGVGAAGDLRAAAGVRPGLRPGGAGPVRAGPRRPASAVLSIAQFGSTRSINAGAAAAIAMHAWIRAHATG